MFLLSLKVLLQNCSFTVCRMQHICDMIGPQRCVTVKYEDLVSNTRSVITKLTGKTDITIIGDNNHHYLSFQIGFLWSISKANRNCSFLKLFQLFQLLTNICQVRLAWYQTWVWHVATWPGGGHCGHESYGDIHWPGGETCVQGGSGQVERKHSWLCPDQCQRRFEIISSTQTVRIFSRLIM